MSFKCCPLLLFHAESTIRCLSHAGLFPWAAVQMVEGTITIHTLLCAAVIVSSLLTSTCLDVLQPLRLYFTVSSNFKRKSIGARTSLFGGPSNTVDLFLSVLSCFPSAIYVTIKNLHAGFCDFCLLGFSSHPRVYLEACLIL